MRRAIGFGRSKSTGYMSCSTSTSRAVPGCRGAAPWPVGFIKTDSFRYRGDLAESLPRAGPVRDAQLLHLLAERLPGVRGGAAHGLELVAEFLQLTPARHQPGEFIPGDLLFRVVADAPATAEQQETVTHRERV